MLVVSSLKSRLCLGAIPGDLRLEFFQTRKLLLRAKELHEFQRKFLPDEICREIKGVHIPDGLLTSSHLVYDTVFSGGETALLRQAHAASAKCADGLSMLLHQGALQNELWFGEPAPLETMRAALSR